MYGRTDAASMREAEMMGYTYSPSPYGTKFGYYYEPSSSSEAAGTDAENSPPPETTTPQSADSSQPPAADAGAGDNGSSTDGGSDLQGVSSLSDVSGVLALDDGQGGSGLELAGAGARLQPVFDVINTTADDVTGSSGLLQGIVTVANTAGVGAIGAAPSAGGHSNLLTDVVNLPGSVLDGDLNGGLSHLTADLTDTIGAATGLVGDVLGVTGLQTDSLLGDNGLVGDVLNLPSTALDGGIPQTIADLTDAVTGITGSADGLAGNGLLTPVTNLVGSLGDDLQHNSVLGIGSGDGLTGIVSGTIGSLGSSSSGDAAQVAIGPETDSGLGLGVLAPADGSHTADASVLDVGSGGPELANLGLLSDADGLNVPLLSGLGLPDIGDTGPSGLLTINGGNNANDGGLLGGVIGDLNGSSSGHLVNADVGPHDDSGLGVGVLTSQSGADHTASVSAVDTGPQGPQLADLGVLTGDLINVPSLNGAGLDSLTGDLLGSHAPPAAASPAAPASLAANLGEVLDLLPGSVTGDHGIVDVNSHHII